MCEDRYQRLWVGTDDGLNRFDPVREKFTVFRPDAKNKNSLSHPTIFSLYRDSHGTLWVGTTGGLNRFDDSRESFSRYLHDPNIPTSISANYIWKMLEDSSGLLNIGTQTGGLNRFDPVKGTFKSYQQDPQNSSSLSSNKVLSLYCDHTGTLWIGTTNGLNKFDGKTGAIQRYSEQDGLPNNSIQGILEDHHGRLWIGTNHGLSQFNPLTSKFKNFLESSGLQSNEFSPNACVLLNSGEMAFGGIDGYTLFHPDSICDDVSVPTVVLTDFQIFNKHVPLGVTTDGRTILTRSITESDAIHLSYTENVFSFEFAGLHYASPEDNLYAYMMGGFEKAWNYTKANRRFVTYTNLNPGTYIFHVKASNKDGVWNEAGTAITITITPPFWQTAWFRLGGIGLFISALVIGYKVRTARIRSRNRELEKHILERTVQLETANKELESFSYSVSHDLRSPLRSIDGFSNALLEDYSKKLDEKGKDYLQRVRAASQHMEQLIDDLLNLSRVMRTEMQRSSVDLSILAQTITNDLVRTQPDRKVRFIIAPGMVVHADRNLMKIVLDNLFDNAWKFSSKHPTATIEFGTTTTQGQTAYFVRDDGDGFEMAYAGKLFTAFQRMHTVSEFKGTGIGLTTVQRIINRHGGKVWAEAKKDNGATIYFTIPSL
jgi:signal transduction histidine kinase